MAAVTASVTAAELAAAPAYVWTSDAPEPWLDGGGRVLPQLLTWATGGRLTAHGLPLE